MARSPDSKPQITDVIEPVNDDAPAAMEAPVKRSAARVTNPHSNEDMQTLVAAVTAVMRARAQPPKRSDAWAAKSPTTQDMQTLVAAVTAAMNARARPPKR